MSIATELELTATWEKLRKLERTYKNAVMSVGGDAHLRDLELRSLKKLVNQLTEEIVRYEGRSVVGVRQ